MKTTTTTTSFPTLRYSIGDVVCPGDRLGTSRQAQAGRGTRGDGDSSSVALNDVRTTTPITTKAQTPDGRLYATVVGRLEVRATTPTSPGEDVDMADISSSSPLPPCFTCSVQETLSSTSVVDGSGSSPPPPPSRPPLLASSYIPRVGQLVVGKILRITPQNAVVQLIMLEGVGPITQLGALEGTIKREDVSSAAIEAVSTKETGSGSIIEQAFQPTDVISCRIVNVSSGDASNRQRCYDLSTAEVELGVLYATCKTCPTTTNATAVARLVPKSWREMMCSVCGRMESRKVAKPPVI